MGTIYVLKNKVNGMCYVGQTINPFNIRFRQHCQAHSYVGNALRKYGAGNFEKVLIKNIPEKKLNEEEIKYIKECDCISPKGYNLTHGGDGKYGPCIKDIEIMKHCNKCNIKKKLSEFHIDNSKKDGRKNICKECRKSTRRKLSKERKVFDRNINASIYKSIKLNKSGRIWERVVGHTLNDLKEHLEKQFTKEMSWDNYGNYWWIDKIIPRRAYIYTDVRNNELRKCWCLKNMRPLSKKDCQKKKDRIIWELIEEYSLFDILPSGLLIIDKK